MRSELVWNRRPRLDPLPPTFRLQLFKVLSGTGDF
jgi:hypothetical protein